MPKLPTVRPRQVVAALEKAGFRPSRQQGSHLQLKKGNLLVTIPMHPGDLNPAVLRSVLRQARLTVEEFVALLAQ